MTVEGNQLAHDKDTHKRRYTDSFSSPERFLQATIILYLFDTVVLPRTAETDAALRLSANLVAGETY